MSAPADPGPAIDRPGAVDRCPRCGGSRTESMTWTGGDRWRLNPCTACTLDVAEATAAMNREAS